MRRPAILPLVVLLGLAGTARAEFGYQCTPATAKSLSFNRDLSQIRYRGEFVPPAGFDPLANGLTIEIGYEPELDPTNGIFTATLPAAGFANVKGTLQYRDNLGSVNGVTVARFQPRKGLYAFTLARKGTALAANHAGALRVVIGAGSCVRACPSVCVVRPNGRLSCGRSRDTALCGVKSGCDLLNAYDGKASPSDCLLPYPSDFFQKADATTPTGLRHAYPLQAMPANGDGTHVDPSDWNVLDGYSPGAILTTHFPQGVDLAASGVNTWQNYAPSVSPTSPTLLIDATTCERIEHFAENDTSTAPGNVQVAAPNQVFMIRPGRRLQNAHRYLVAIRGLVGLNPAGPIPPSVGFKALRDGVPSGIAAIEARRPRMNQIFADLQTCGVAKSNLLLAWDFTTASDDSIQRYMLKMRDETLGQLGSAAPAFTVTQVEDDPFGDPRVCRRVRGTFDVPLYMTADAPGATMVHDPLTGLPVQSGVAVAPFTAIIPCSIANAPSPSRAIFYGHGLLGSGFGEVSADNLRNLSQNYRFVVVATDWQGMSSADFNTVIDILADFSQFRKLPDRLHQGILNQLVLAHLMAAPHGLSTDPAFVYGGTPVIDPQQVFYYGNSQGGIFGGTVMALEQEVTRGVLGVPAANFSTLLQRSVDFLQFFVVLRLNYPDNVDRAMVYPLIEELWQRAEPLGWHHRTVTNPLPGTPAHKVLVHMATGDAEVSNVATEIMVRSMGIPQVSPVVKSYYNVPELAAPFDGSAMVESDNHYPALPIGNRPPANNTAHGTMRTQPAMQAQIDQFLRPGGNVQNFCSGPCDPQ